MKLKKYACGQRRRKGFFNVSKNVSSLTKTSVLKKKTQNRNPNALLVLLVGHQMVNFPAGMEK